MARPPWPAPCPRRNSVHPGPAQHRFHESRRGSLYGWEIADVQPSRIQLAGQFI